MFGIDQEAIIAFVKANQHYAPLVVFLMSMAETIVVLSVLVPSTFLLFAIGGLLAAGGVPLMPSLIAGGLGASLGYAMMYLISASLNERILTLWPFRNYPEMIEKTRSFLRRRGILAVFLGHYAGPLRVLVPIVAGVSHMPPAPFMFANALGAAGWICLFLAPGYLVVSSEWFRTTFSGFVKLMGQ